MSARLDKQTHKIEQEVISQNLPLNVQIDKVAKIRGWFRPRDDSKWFPIIRAYLNGETDLDETLRKVTAPIDEAINADTLNDGFPWDDLWYSVIHSAKRISYRDEAAFGNLIALMKAFKERDVPAKENGEPAYEGLPEFGLYSREAFNDSPGGGAGYTAPEVSAWASCNYFLARLTQDGLFDSSLFAFWTLSEALEQNITDSGEEDDMAATMVQKIDAFVPAAAVWVIGAGKALYEQKEDNHPKHGKKATMLEDLKDHESMWPRSARFSRERWAFWKQRFGEIAAMETIGEETRKVANEAVRAMEKIEDK
ncbi:hypothetical protein K458DRAFT_439719 [Lentithecium fluviatile CBS 122367]|uniref:Uncharacterized protein n=1 Tax=Lentithecium fluviatile CBS 122367 TaxID=1168545 RepID=A0A6G1JG05_9PLEO|nr:hypothetical protein K458DRAFT_439719 [Lentithecium fluviatile CBS 122367]